MQVTTTLKTVQEPSPQVTSTIVISTPFAQIRVCELTRKPSRPS
jgi:hypothetical protein